MTVTYTAEVANASTFGCFAKLLIKWRGSIYKLIWKELFAFLCIYYMLSAVYRLLLSEKQQRNFENIVYYCESYGSIIPLSFVLGFYVNNVMARWWEQYISIPTPDSIAIFVASHLNGWDERGRIMRRTIMRYVCLSLTIVLSMVSPRVKRRFPSFNELRAAGLLMSHEQQVLEDMQREYPLVTRPWMPLVWATNIVTRARKEGRIREDYIVKTIVDELNKFRGSCSALLNYDSISIPLVYTQVVTLAVYSYFLAQVIGHQWLLDDSRSKVNMYFPVYTSLQFFFYMGWLKVAESMINPFGDDDDDFEINWMADRNIQVAYLIVDEMYQEHPMLKKDKYWEEGLPMELPYQEGNRRDSVPTPSTNKLDHPHPNIFRRLANSISAPPPTDDAEQLQSETPAEPFVGVPFEDSFEEAVSGGGDNTYFDRLRQDRIQRRQSRMHGQDPNAVRGANREPEASLENEPDAVNWLIKTTDDRD